MQVTFTHDMRLNLIAIMDQQPCKIATAMAIWKLQDKIRLNKEESEAVGLKEILNGGAKQAIWDSTKSIPARQFDLSDQEISLIKTAIDDMEVLPRYRDWLEPLMAELEAQPEQPRPVAVPKRR